MTITDRLDAALGAGELLDLLPNTPTGRLLDEAEMRDWDSSHDLDAELLRQLILSSKDSQADPRGLQLRGARIRGHLDLDNVNVPIAVLLEDCLLDDGLTAEQAHLPALRLRRCRVSHPDQPALHADLLQVDGTLELGGSVFTAATAQSAVRLLGARIGSQLNLRGATLRNPGGPALAADGLQTAGSVFLDEGFTAGGDGEGGAVRLRGARIGGVLSLRGAIVHNPTGPAVTADGLQTDDTVVLDDLTAEGAGDDSAVVLGGARIGGQLHARGTTVRNPTGPALLANDLQAEGDVIFRGFTAGGAGGSGVVRLRGARIGGQLYAHDCAVRNKTSRGHHWDIAGLTYSGVPQLTQKGNRQDWLELLRTGTPHYAAQPFQQLAASYRADGHDGDVRRILIAQRRDEIARGGLGRAERWWAKATGVLLGYGYQPWRALLWLAGVLAVSVVLALVLGAQGALARTTSPPTEPPEAPACTVVQTIGRGLDLGAPFLPTAPATVGSCQPTASPAGDALTMSRWFLQMAAWALAALFIAGFTGIVRKT